MHRILIVDIASSSGGVEKLIDSIYDRLDKSIYQIDFLIYGDKCFNEEKYSKNGNIFKVAKRYVNPIRHFYEIKKFFKNHTDYETVWIQTRSSSNINAHKFARKYTKAKIITHSHAIRPETKNILHRFITSILMKKNQKTLTSCTDYAVACSKDAYQYMFGNGYTGEGKVIINGIDLSRFRYNQAKREKVRDKYNLSPTAFLIGHVGRMVPVKNHKFVIDVFEELSKKNPSYALMLIGDGPERQFIENYVTNHNLEGKVLFTGEVKDVTPFLSAFDVFILPSLFEGLPLSAIEGQAEGLPVFLSDRVPEDALATREAYRLPLEIGAEAWAKKIDECMKNRNKDRQEVYNEMVKSPYNIENTMKEIQKIIGV